MFDSIKGSRSKKKETKQEFLERAKLEREARKESRVLDGAIVRLQKWVRRIQEAQRARKTKRDAWDAKYQEFLPPDFKTLDLGKGDSMPFSKTQPTAEDLYKVVSDFLQWYRPYDADDHRRLLILCHVVLQSMESTQPEYNYASNVLESRSGAWQFQIRSFLLVCMRKICPPPSITLPTLASAGGGGPAMLKSSRSHSLGSSRATSRGQSRLHSRRESRDLEELLEKDRSTETLPLRALVVFTDASSWRICTTVMFTDTGGRLGKQTFYSRISMSFLDSLVREGLYTFVHAALERALMGVNAHLRSARAVEDFFKSVLLLAVRPLQFPQTWPIPSKIHDKYLQFALAVFSHANIAERLPPTAAGLYQRRETFCGCVMALENAASAVLPRPPVSMLAGHEARLRALVGNLVEFAVPWLPSLEDMVPPFVQLLQLVFTLDYEFLYPASAGRAVREALGELEPGFLAQVQHLWSPHFVQLLFRRLLAREERKRDEAKAKSASGTAASFFGTNELGFDAAVAAAAVAQSKEAKARKRGIFARLGGGGGSHAADAAGPSAPAAPSPANGGEDEMEGTSSSGSRGGRSRSRGGGIGGPSMAALRVSESTLVCAMYVAVAQRLKAQRVHVLNALAFLPDLLAGVFRLVRENRLLELHLRPNLDDPLIPLFSFFCECYAHLLVVVDDEEFFVRQSPFPLKENATLADMLNRLVFRLHWRGGAEAPLAAAASALLQLLHTRDARRHFCDPRMWLLQDRDVTVDAVMMEAMQGQPRAMAVLRSVPHVIPFERRVELFRAVLARERAAHQRAVHIRVRRGLVIEDGFAQLSAQAAGALKNPVKVTFVNAAGLEEAGIDQRGLFKEFLEEATRLAFGASYGLWVPNGERHLYPSPASGAAQPNHLALFRFVGRLLAKAVYEGIVVEIPLASFFLLKLLGRRPTIEDLPSLDAPLYKSLAFLKTYTGSVGDLSMDFTVTDDVMGQKKVYELRPGGSKVSVTEQNRIVYIHLMADFRLNRQIAAQCDAFLTGFYDVVAPDALRLFNSPAELQRLIAGDNAEISVEDMRRHTVYAGGYASDNKVIKMFWEVVEEMTAAERRALLRFATSCSRPPLLGFGYLQPPFTIHQVQNQATSSFSFFGLGVQDTDRLPTAATCFNTLKLPAYKKKKTMRDKLLQAISSGSGFELS